MDIYRIPSSKKQEMEKILSQNEIFRLSTTIKDGSVFGDEGFLFLALEGLKERLELARNELSKIEEKLDKKKKTEVERYIEDERNNVYDSFGTIFK